MPIIELQDQPGTIRDPQHTTSSDARWTDTDKVHFPDGKLTPIPSFFESLGANGSVDIQGTCRAQWAGRLGGESTIAGAYYLTGTHSGLYAEYQAIRYNITPFAGQRFVYLDENPLSTATGDATLTIAIPSHGLSVGDLVTIYGASDVAGVTADDEINEEQFSVGTVPDSDSITIEMGVSAASDATGGGDAVYVYTLAATADLDNVLNTTSGSSIVVVDYVGHGLVTGDRVKIDAVNSTGGIGFNSLRGEFTITRIDDDSFSYDAGSNATSTVSSGGGANGKIFLGVAAGNENQDFLSGYGAGAYGAGAYGTNRFSSTTPSFPRISSFDNFGNSFLYCPGDYDAGDGQKIYEWNGDRDTAPTVLLDAPENCNWVAVIANQIIALCGTNIVIGLTDPTTGRAQWPNIPSDSPIGDVIPVQRATRLLSVAALGEKAGIVFAPEPLLLRLVGGVWDLSELGAEYPIVAPAAFCQVEDGIMWYAQDGNYYFCNGGAVRKVVNRQCGEYVRGQLNKDAIWTTFLMQDQKHNQVWHYYPSGSSNSPDEYVVFNPDNQSFTVGSQSRTSGQRPSFVDNRFFMADGGTIYNSFTTDSVTFNWSAKSAYFYLDPEYRFKIVRAYPDMVINGTINMKICGKEHPNDEAIDYGTYTIDSNTTVMTVRAASRLISIEFSGSSDFTLAGLRMKVERKGRRRA